MTREEEAVKVLKRMIKTGIAYDDGYAFEPLTEDEEKACSMAIKALEQEPKTGHWIVHPKGIYAHLVCDKCLFGAPYDCNTNYCPNCGAKMAESEGKE